MRLPVTILFILLIAELSGQTVVTDNPYIIQPDDSLIIAENYTVYMSQACLNRSNLVKAMEEGNEEEVRRLQNVKILLDQGSEYYGSPVALTTYREHLLLKFSQSDFNFLLTELERGRHYFNKGLDRSHREVFMECGNLAAQLLPFWKESRKSIFGEIEKASLSDEEILLLKLYWDSIMGYIESGDTLPGHISEDASNFLSVHPNSRFSGFASYLKSLKKVRYISAMTLGTGFGGVVVNNSLDDILNDGLTMELDFGANIGQLHAVINLRYQGFESPDEYNFMRVDTLTIDTSSRVSYGGGGLRIGYDLLKSPRLHLKPMVSLELNKVRSSYENFEGEWIQENGKVHFQFGTGLDFAILVRSKNSTYTEPHYSYSYREENEAQVSGIFLNFRAMYYPDPFARATDTKGNMLYWSIGANWIVGTNRARYVSRE